MHTTERLVISKIRPNLESYSHIIQAEGGRIIALLIHHPGQRPKELAIAQEQADAERLVASWNFALPIPMEAGELMAESRLADCRETEQVMIRAAANAGFSFRIVPGGNMRLERDEQLLAFQKEKQD